MRRLQRRLLLCHHCPVRTFVRSTGYCTNSSFSAASRSPSVSGPIALELANPSSDEEDSPSPVIDKGKQKASSDSEDADSFHALSDDDQVLIISDTIRVRNPIGPPPPNVVKQEPITPTRRSERRASKKGASPKGPRTRGAKPSRRGVGTTRKTARPVQRSIALHRASLEADIPAFEPTAFEEATIAVNARFVSSPKPLPFLILIISSFSARLHVYPVHCARARGVHLQRVGHKVRQVQEWSSPSLHLYSYACPTVSPPDSYGNRQSRFFFWYVPDGHFYSPSSY